MYQKQLQTIGLSTGEAEIYEILLTLGPSPARDILKKTSIKRGNVYNILDLLVKKGMATADTAEPKTVFAPASPTTLQNILTRREESVRLGRANLADVLDELRSLYSLVQDKPAVRFFEGAEGIKKVLYDSLSAKGEIYTFADTEAVEEHVKQLNLAYVKKRLEAKIAKKIIALDTPFARAHYTHTQSALTEVRLIPAKLAPFKTGMQMYNNTISYATISHTKMIGVIIEDERIAQMHRSLFEYIWSTLLPLKSSAKTPAPRTSPSSPLKLLSASSASSVKPSSSTPVSPPRPAAPPSATAQS